MGELDGPCAADWSAVRTVHVTHALWNARWFPGQRTGRRIADRDWLFGLGLAVALALPAGCADTRGLKTAPRLERGYVIVLPGVEGKSPMTTSVAHGLADGGVPSAIEVYDWTVGVPWVAPVWNLRAAGHNRNEARKIAQKIVDYQNRYPGQPVHLIGHSGGGGIAVWALEALPPGHEITSAILLAPAISPNYQLSQALRRTRMGVYNFYSPYDVGFLNLGTTMAGTIDGRHGRAAGAIGFSLPWGLTPEDRQLYSTRLHQQRYVSKMAESGHLGNHFGWAKRQFVAEWIASLVNTQMDAQARYAADNPSSNAPSLGGEAPARLEPLAR